MADDQNLNIRITTTADTAGAKQTEAALAGVNQAAGKTAAGAAHAGTEIKHAGQEVKELGRLGHEAEGVLLGLERGGISGLASAAKNLGGIIRALASGTIGAVLIPVVAVASAALFVMKKAAEENAKAIDKMFKDAEKSGKEYEKRVQEIEKVTVESFTKQRLAVAGLRDEYAELDSDVADAEKRSKTLSAANRERVDAELQEAKVKALNAASTPEAKAKVEKEYDLLQKKNVEERKALDIQNAALNADVKSGIAKDELSKASGRQDQARIAFDKLKTDREEAIRKAGSFRSDDTSEEARAARVEADAQNKAFDKAKEEFTATIKEIAVVIKKAEKDISDAKLTKEEASVKGKTLAAQERTRIAELSGTSDAESAYRKAGETTASIQEAISAEEDRAVKSHKFGDQADTASLKVQLAAAQKSEAEKNQAFIDDAKARKKEADNIKQQLKNTREGGS